MCRGQWVMHTFNSSSHKHHSWASVFSTLPVRAPSLTVARPGVPDNQISRVSSPPLYMVTAVRYLDPTKTALSPSSSSIRKIWFSLARRSERAGAPVLICPQRSPTAISAIVTSSVSPDRWETMTPHPAAYESLAAWIDSVSVPIWLTFSSRALHDLSSIAFLMRWGFVTVKSSLNAG